MIEGLGAMFEGGFIFAAGLFIVYEAIHKAMSNDVAHDSVVGIVTMLPVLGVTIATVVQLRKAAKATGSLVLRSDALHYMTDVWVNVGVLVSLVLVKLTGLPVIDTVISIGIALFMVYSSLAVVREGFDVVMDTSLPPESIAELTALLRECKAIDSFHDFKTRRGKYAHVDFHVVVRPDMTAREIHDLYEELRDGIRALVGSRTAVLMHTDPRGEPDDDAGRHSAPRLEA
jgi:cation diffusion facilitator family transporter